MDPSSELRMSVLIFPIFPLFNTSYSFSEKYLILLYLTDIALFKLVFLNIGILYSTHDINKPKPKEGF